MSGAPGAGKSTVANLLATSINAVVLDHDVIRSFFLENGHAFGLSAKLAYDFQWKLAGDILRQERNVIIDSPCNYQETLDQGATLAHRYNYDYQYVECQVKDIDLLDQRLRSRVPQRSQRTGVREAPLDARDLNGGKDDTPALFTKYPARPATNAIIVDSTSRPEDCLGKILGQMALLTGSPTSQTAPDLDIQEAIPSRELPVAQPPST
jgi:predicted kinase